MPRQVLGTFTLEPMARELSELPEPGPSPVPVHLIDLLDRGTLDTAATIRVSVGHSIEYQIEATG